MKKILLVCLSAALLVLVACGKKAGNRIVPQAQKGPSAPPNLLVPSSPPPVGNVSGKNLYPRK